MKESLLRGFVNRLCQHLARILPGARSLRVALHRARGVKIGKNVWIGYDVILDTSRPSLIKLEDGCELSMRVTVIAHFRGATGVTVEEGAFVGPGATDDGCAGQPRNSSGPLRDPAWAGYSAHGVYQAPQTAAGQWRQAARTAPQEHRGWNDEEHGLALVFASAGAPRDIDRRMIRLAEFLGIPSQTLTVDQTSLDPGFWEAAIPAKCSSLVISSQTIREWVGPDSIPPGLAASLLSRFTHLLVYGLRADEFDSKVVSELSGGEIRSVERVSETDGQYVISKNAARVCGVFSGLSFGPVNPVNDRVLCPGAPDSAVKSLISIGGRPFMAAVRTA
jgi:hypothetical protein